MNDGSRFYVAGNGYGFSCVRRKIFFKGDIGCTVSAEMKKSTGMLLRNTIENNSTGTIDYRHRRYSRRKKCLPNFQSL